MQCWRLLGSLPVVLALAAAGCTSLRRPAARHISSAEATTRQHIIDTVLRIREYMIQERRYPPDLTQLPTLDDRGNDTKDAWGRPLLYEVGPDGVITLTSLGRDGRPGGTKADADIRRRYRTLNADGTSNIDDEYWIVTQAIDPLPGDDEEKHPDGDTPAAETRDTDRTRTP